jgi:flagellar hook-associated protein 3 FlgL
VSIVLAGTYDDGGDFLDASKSAKEKVDTVLDEKGRLQVVDKTTTDTKLRLTMFDAGSRLYSTATADTTTGNLMSFQSNNALTVDDPHHDFFDALDEAIEAVENGFQRPDGNHVSMARNLGVQYSMDRIDHVLEHVSKEHTKVGAISHRLDYSVERNQTLKLNVQMLRSDTIDTDIADATLRLNQLSLNYQAMMSAVARIQKLSLVNYL